GLHIHHSPPGLNNQGVARAPDGTVVRKAGIMAIVTTGGVVRPGDAVEVELPVEPHRPLERV
ncbi:MOSC domain-containing protein, partial [Streptomyces sp. NPDC057067]